MASSQIHTGNNEVQKKRWTVSGRRKANSEVPDFKLFRNAKKLSQKPVSPLTSYKDKNVLIIKILVHLGEIRQCS